MNDEGIVQWNPDGRTVGERIDHKANPAEDPVACPLCHAEGYEHIFAEPRLRRCVHPDCGWFSCPACSVSWSGRTGAIMPMNRPPSQIYLERFTPKDTQ